MKNNEQARTFEASLEALEHIVRELEQGGYLLRKVSNYLSRVSAYLANVRIGLARPNDGLRFCLKIITAGPWSVPLKDAKGLAEENEDAQEG